MKRSTISLLITTALMCLFPINSESKTLTVAVIDTGIDPSVGHLCKQGHKDFNKGFFYEPNPLNDAHGHGTHVAGIIVSNAGNVDYCLVSLKFYRDKNLPYNNVDNTLRALRYAIDINVDFINYSGGGEEDSKAEKQLIKEALDKGIVVIVAAGNESSNLDKECNYFPACEDARLIVVGNLKTYGNDRAAQSNYGSRVNRWEVGTNVYSTLPGGRHGRMSGTSQATAVATGKLVKAKGSK